MYSLAELHQSVEASLNDGEQGGCFNSLRIMSLLWLLVSDCEQRGCFHRLHIMSLLWLWYPTANNGVVFNCCTSGD
ncbi:hypothetical protein BME31_19145 [Klebsiella quasipneumoniae subsp. similipneumoniae]|nr:hypothetical protein BME31_19145 [Klebsiella quasipneumoniae subsp. similipneumoniae]